MYIFCNLAKRYYFLIINNNLNILLVSLLFFITSCAEKTDQKIQADDFGFDKIFVNASNQDNNKGNDILTSSESVEIKKWQDSDLITTGKSLILSIPESSYWVPWLGQDEENKAIPILGSQNMPDCQYEIIPNSDPTLVEAAKELSAPCKVRYGVGLYGLITKKSISEVNDIQMRINLESQSDNDALFHVGQSYIASYNDPKLDIFGKYNNKYINIFGYSLANKKNIILKKEINQTKQIDKNTIDNKLYFQIYDNYYSDNTGGYEVAIKAGATKQNQISNWIDQNIIKYIFGDTGIIKDIYNGIIQSSYFSIIINAMLISYVTIFGAMMLSGTIQVPIKEGFVLILKIIFLTQLITLEKSWDFFNTYVFQNILLFIFEIKNAINSSGSGDILFIIKLLTGKEFLHRIFAILTLNPLTWLYGIIVYILILMIGIQFALSYIKYIIVFLYLGLLIVSAPIFIPFILFETTKDLCTNWIKAIFNASLQIILIITGLTLISNIIKDMTQKYFGFPVCYKSKLFGLIIVPDVCISDKKSKILIPDLYTTEDLRFIDLPFLDPKDQIIDKNIINSMLSENYIFIEYVILLSIIWYTFKYYATVIESTANKIVSGISGFSSEQALNNTKITSGLNKLPSLGIYAFSVPFKLGAYLTSTSNKVTSENQDSLIKKDNLVARTFRATGNLIDGLAKFTENSSNNEPTDLFKKLKEFNSDIGAFDNIKKKLNNFGLKITNPEKYNQRYKYEEQIKNLKKHAIDIKKNGLGLIDGLSNNTNASLNHSVINQHRNNLGALLDRNILSKNNIFFTDANILNYGEKYIKDDLMSRFGPDNYDNKLKELKPNIDYVKESLSRKMQIFNEDASNSTNVLRLDLQKVNFLNNLSSREFKFYLKSSLAFRNKNSDIKNLKERYSEIMDQNINHSSNINKNSAKEILLSNANDLLNKHKISSINKRDLEYLNSYGKDIKNYLKDSEKQLPIKIIELHKGRISDDKINLYKSEIKKIDKIILNKLETLTPNEAMKSLNNSSEYQEAIKNIRSINQDMYNMSFENYINVNQKANQGNSKYNINDLNYVKIDDLSNYIEFTKATGASNLQTDQINQALNNYDNTAQSSNSLRSSLRDKDIYLEQVQRIISR